MENMIGIAALIFSVGAAVAFFGIGVYFLTGAGREGVRIARDAERLEQERNTRPS